MNETNKIIVIVGVCLTLLAIGCKSAPVLRLEPAAPPQVDRVDPTSSVCRELAAAGLPLSAKQAQALLPPAEHAMKVSELPKFLAGQAAFDGRTAAATMAQIDEEFVAGKGGAPLSMQTQPAEGNWQSDDALLNCTIWLYHWQIPSKMMPKGLLLAHEEGLGLSSYFLVQDGVVVQAGYIARREK